MPNLYIPGCALVLATLLIIVFFSKKRAKNDETQLYTFLLISSFIDSLLLYIILYIGYVSPNSLALIFLLNKIDFSMYIIWIWLMFIYFFKISITKENVPKYYDIIFKITLVINIILIIIMWVLPIDIINHDGQMGVTGIAVDFSMVIFVIYLIFIIAVSLFKFKIINKKYAPLYVLIVLLSISLITKKNNPTFLFTSAIIAYVNLIMYFTIENPDMKLINKLELAKNTAEKANRAKTEFLSSISHEIRTPLNAIVGLSEIINKTDDIKEIHEDSKDIVNASYTLLEIVNSILDISKIEAGKMEIVKVNYNPRDEIQKLAKLLETRIGSKDLKLYVEIDNNLPNVLYGDLNKVKQIISNLLSNAIKYTESGRVDLKVVVENTDKICNLEIMVKDTGRGIKEEQLSHLFTKFDRLEADKNTSIEGTGLGLAITKSLVEMLGGTINVESTYGVGSMFTVTIPEEISDAILETTETESITKYNGVTSLIVDDSKLNLKVAEKILSEYGLTSETVLSGDECIEKIKRGNNYDIIFMDIMMPNKGGVETLKELKSLPNFNTPVVALTADAMEGQKEAYLSAGFIAYLSKPIDRQELESFLKKELKDKVTIENTKSSVKEETKPVEKENNKEELLTSVGLDLKKAYEFFMDIDTLIPQLKEYLTESVENKSTMEKSYNKKDDINYEIVVHKLKSESRMLGLTDLGEMFYNHELAAKRKDWDYINKEYTSLISEYDKVLNVLEKL